MRETDTRYYSVLEYPYPGKCGIDASADFLQLAQPAPSIYFNCGEEALFMPSS